MFLGSERAAKLIILAGEVLLIEPQRKLILSIERKIALHHEDVLISVDRIGTQLWQEQRLDAGWLRKEVCRVKKIR